MGPPTTTRTPTALVRARPLLAFVLLACTVSWGIWGAGLAVTDRPWRLESSPGLSLALTAGTFGPSVAAVIVTGVVGGRPGVRALLRSLMRFRVGWRVYALTVFLPPTVLLAVFALTGIEPARESGWAVLVVNAVVAMPLNAVIGGVVLGSGPLGEELGWRGFALPHLVRARGDLGASVLLGLMWTLWHAPLAVIVDWRTASWPVFLIAYPMSLIALSLVLTTIWRWSGRSVALTILGHAVLNQVALLATSENAFDLAGTSPDRLYVTVVGVFWVIAVLMLLIPPRWVPVREPHEEDVLRTAADPGESPA